MAKTGPMYPDSIVNGCIVGRSKSGWTWLCKTCGRGHIYDRYRTNRWHAEKAAKEHECPTIEKVGEGNETSHTN